jgi:periplasmic divalent cation tolerance protein
MKTQEFCIVLSTCPNGDVADTIARELVERGLAACVNILPSIRSVYTWKDKVETASEHLLLVKAHARQYKAIETCVRQLHPYELPEIIAVPITGGLDTYLSWLERPEATHE